MEKRSLDLCNYRLEKAGDDLESSELLFNNNKLLQSINRSYYSIFHAARALLALIKFDSKKHSGIISLFNRHYVKSGKIEKEFSRILADAFEIRNESDYNDFYFAAKEDAQLQLENAKKFLKRVLRYIDTVVKQEEYKEEE